MLSNLQKSLLKRAQRETGLSDDDYRDALEMIAGCRSSTSPALTDRHLDKLLGYFEAIHWRAVDAGTLQPSCSTNAVFRQRGYWADKNTNQETSRDRFNESNLGGEIASFERQLADLGCGGGYCWTIRRTVTKGRDDAHALHLYCTALQRTLKAKARQKQTAGKNPF
jgi:hypothetical protein